MFLNNNLFKPTFNNFKMPKAKKTQSIKKPVWLKYTKEEVKAIILKLANKGLTAEKIGLTLRDQYGIPNVKLYNLRIKDILKQNNLYKEPTVINLKEKLSNIINHYKKNKQDKKTERSLIITRAKLKKREIYEQKKEK